MLGLPKATELSMQLPKVSQKQAEERKPFVLPEPAGDNCNLTYRIQKETN